AFWKKQGTGAIIDPFTWTGAGGYTNWNNNANWYGGVAPTGSSDYAIFDGSVCGSTCNATINTNITISATTLLPNYGGTLTQGSGVTFALLNGYTQEGGTFAGSNGTIGVGGPI